MMTDDEVNGIAQGWIREYSSDPYIVREDRDRTFFFILDDIIYKNPEEALRIFLCVSKKELVNWTLEGFGVGPLRTFLMLYEGAYDKQLTDLRKISTFDEMYVLAEEGL